MSTLLALLLAAGFVMQANDLDQFMEQVLVQRDQNWKKLQQYVLEEREAFEVTGPGGTPLYGLRRDYAWFIRNDIFVRSPTTVDGVRLSEADRQKAEAEFIAEELRAALDAIGEIVGKADTEDLLGAIFGRFCIGK